MENPTEWNWKVKGILALYLDHKCKNCIYLRKSRVCKLSIPSVLIPNTFCLFFKNKYKTKLPRITLEDLQKSGVFTYEGPIYFISKENYFEAKSLNREVSFGNRVRSLIERLDSMKGNRSFSEARTLRKDLRELGFSLRKRFK